MAEQKAITVDFSKAGEGDAGVRIPEGDYHFKIAAAKHKIGKESEEPYIQFAMEVVSGPSKGKKVPHRCSLQEQALWNLRNLLEACGKEVPRKAVKINLEKMVGWECGGTVVDEEYNRRTKSVIAAVFPVDELKKTSKGKGGEELESELEEPAAEETEELFE